MTPWLEDADCKLYHGDNLDVLRTLPDKSVHMCATSPPFYGLRDYGTGEWEGGKDDCDHRIDPRPYQHGQGRQGNDYGTPPGGNASRTATYPSECGKCGARRVDKQIGLEETPDQWVQNLVRVFREVRRVLRDDGTLWVEIGDSYTSGGRTWPTPEQIAGGKQATSKSWMEADPNSRPPTPEGLKAKDLIGQPWLLAFALRADGWWLRSEIIWARPNPMPESVTDRPTKSHSTVFLLSKQPRYFYDADAIREQYQKDNRTVTTVKGTDASHQHRNGERWPNETGANARSVWTIPTQPTPFAHFATWPEALCRRMILAGTSEKGCCPECGAPWVREVERGESDYARLGKQNGADFGRGDSQPGNMGQTRTATGAVPSLKAGGGTTIGWVPSCDHYDKVGYFGEDAYEGPPPVPCTVLDPFAGSATTNLVARNHGRHSIGIELNEDYLQIAAKRLQQLSLLAEA